MVDGGDLVGLTVVAVEEEEGWDMVGRMAVAVVGWY